MVFTTSISDVVVIWSINKAGALSPLGRTGAGIVNTNLLPLKFAGNWFCKTAFSDIRRLFELYN